MAYAHRCSAPLHHPLALYPAQQDPGTLDDTSYAKLDAHFHTNLYPMFVLSKLCKPHLQPGSSIINSTSVTAYSGQPTLLEYSSTKGIFGVGV